MSTVLILDVSLSMSRPVPITDCTEEYQRRHLAVHGINMLLDFFSSNCKMEFVSLVAFSSLWEQLVPFTRDFDSIKSALEKIEVYDKTCIEPALSAVGGLVLDEWGIYPPAQVILITDGSSGIGPGSLKHSLETLNDRNPLLKEEKFPLPFVFPSKLHVMCIAPNNDPSLQTSLLLYQRLIELNKGCGEVFVPDGQLSMATVEQMFSALTEKYYPPFYGVLKAGNLKCNVQLFPSPYRYDCLQAETETGRIQLSKSLEICGLIDIGDIASPPYISKHLVLPTCTSVSDEREGVKKEDEEETEESKSAAFTVLLHGSLKVEGMVAVTQLGENWFGIIYSWADNKKKSNLMLSVFERGSDMLPWLGNLSNLATISSFTESPYGEDDSKTPFPIRTPDRRSYAQNCVVWIKPTGLQADIQKILRNARKLPEKQQHFYKELNRLRRAALSLGFLELLDAVAQLLERECTQLPGNAHPDAALQLTHAANALRGPGIKDFSQNIMPLRTNFSGDQH